MSTGRPNVLLILADDQRFDTLHALGNHAIRTPNLDRLIERGTTFTEAHIPGGTSAAVCMPSRAMLHTGRGLFHIEGAGESIPEAHTTIGEAFRTAGYRTFGAGKWHNGRSAFHRSFSGGDEIFFGGMTDHWNVPAYHYDPTGRYDAVLLETPDPMRSNKVNRRACDHIHPGRHSSEIIADAAIEFLRNGRGDGPFFAYVSFLAPHDPRTMPQAYLEMYDPEAIQLPPNFAGGHPFDNGDLHIRDEMLAGFPRTPEEIRRHMAEYYAMITHLDAQVGRILGALDETGAAEETLVIFAADNGLAVGQHGLVGKQSCYEHSVRVPLVFAGPGVPQGLRTEARAYLFDVFPTLCDLTEIETPESVEGKSLARAMRVPGETLRESLYFAYRHLQRAVKMGDRKLIEYVIGGRHTMTQLFDLAADPWETRNLAADPERADDVRALRLELRRLAEETGDVGSEWGTAFWSGFSVG